MAETCKCSEHKPGSVQFCARTVKVKFFCIRSVFNTFQFPFHCSFSRACQPSSGLRCVWPGVKLGPVPGPWAYICHCFWPVPETVGTWNTDKLVNRIPLAKKYVRLFTKQACCYTDVTHSEAFRLNLSCHVAILPVL